MIRNNLVILFESLMHIIFSLPRFRIFILLKISILKLMGAKFGRGVVIYPGVWIMNGRNLIVGNDVDFAYGVLVTTSGGVTIGDRVLIGYRTQILSTNHSIPPIGEKFPISGDDLMGAPDVNLMSQKMGFHEWTYDNHIDHDKRHLVPHVDKELALANLKLEVEKGFGVIRIEFN